MHSGDYSLANGTRLHMASWIPPKEAVRGRPILCCHGVESHGLWFEEVGKYCAERGIPLFAYDRAGWGRSAGERGHFKSYDIPLGELVEIATSLRETYGSVHLAGLSWGGLLALYAALRRGPLFDSLTLIAPGICPKMDVSLGDKFTIGGSCLLGKGTARVPLPMQPEHFTKRHDRREFIRTDSYATKEVSAAFCLETFKMRRFVQEQTARALPPTQLLLAENDCIIDNAATADLLRQFRIRRNQRATQVRIETIANTQHSLVFDAPERVADHLAALAWHDADAEHTVDLEAPTVMVDTRALQEHTVSNAAFRPARNITVMGAGAIGSLVGGLLAIGGHRVTLIGRQAHVDAIAENGLHLSLPPGYRIVRERLHAVADASQVEEAPDAVLLCVKGFDTATALEQIKPLVTKRTALISLQNGIANEPRIAAAFPDVLVIGAEISAYTEFAAPGKIIWQSDKGGLAAGTFQGDEPAAHALWQSMFPDTGMAAPFVTGPNAAQRVKWSKLMLNLAFNALNALNGLPTGEILAHPNYGPLAAGALQEGFKVMAAEGIAPIDLPGYPLKLLAQAARLPRLFFQRTLAFGARKDTGGASSMRQDMMKQKHVTEIDQINGEIVTRGAVHNIPTPANQELCQRIRSAVEQTIAAS